MHYFNLVRPLHATPSKFAARVTDLFALFNIILRFSKVQRAWKMSSEKAQEEETATIAIGWSRKLPPAHYGPPMILVTAPLSV